METKMSNALALTGPPTLDKTLLVVHKKQSTNKNIVFTTPTSTLWY